MQQTAHDPDANTDWSQLRPVLDSAMDRLSERDREAVLLRYFQSRPFAEIGVMVGLSEDAARKRVERALEKLRELLRPHGIASTSTALAALLAGQTVSAAPASLAATVTGAALASGGATAVGVATIFAITKLQVGIAAVVATGGAVGLITQQRTISELHERQVAAQQQITALKTKNAALESEVRFVDVPATSGAVRAKGESKAAISLPRTRIGTAGPELLAGTPAPNPYVTPRAESPLAQLKPLPNTPEIVRQKADMHRRYDPFFRERGLTPEQAERVVELFVQQAIAREDLQASVRATGTPGDMPGVEKLRGQMYEPITRELHEVLGREGYQAYIEYMRTTFYRDGVMGGLLPRFASSASPLSDAQMSELVRVVAANDHPERISPMDIGSRAKIDWDAVVAQSRGVLTPSQLALLENYASGQRTAR
jgi:hypothetical protein